MYLLCSCDECRAISRASANTSKHSQAYTSVNALHLNCRTIANRLSCASCRNKNQPFTFLHTLIRTHASQEQAHYVAHVKQFLLPSFCEYCRFKILNHVICSRSATWGITLCRTLYMLRISQWKRGRSLCQ